MNNQKEYFNNLNIKQVSDNNLFWNSIKPFLSDKEPSSSKIILTEGNGVASNEEEIAYIMKDVFINVTRALNLKKQFTTSNCDPSEFDSRISIKRIHDKYPEIIPESFNFENGTENLSIKKSSTYGSIPASIFR